MKKLRAARFLALGTVLYGALFYTIGAAIKPGYSSVSQFISELNATGTAHAEALGLFGFLPVGTLFAAFLWLATPVAAVEGSSRVGWWLLWSHPVAFISVFLAPCDAGCPETGSTSQSIHNALGLLTYFAGAAGLFLVASAPVLRGSGARSLLRFTGIAFVVLFVVMLMPEVADVRGLLQRVADALLGAAVLVLAWRVVER
ncbi:MAG: DUF998 domain-containing protein [Flavobacteriales bacterium]|nr:DUF998 domain-containing protein [Flavobacteriales bacterium]